MPSFFSGWSAAQRISSEMRGRWMPITPILPAPPTETLAIGADEPFEIYMDRILTAAPFIPSMAALGALGVVPANKYERRRPNVRFKEFENKIKLIRKE